MGPGGVKESRKVTGNTVFSDPKGCGDGVEEGLVDFRGGSGGPGLDSTSPQVRRSSPRPVEMGNTEGGSTNWEKSSGFSRGRLSKSYTHLDGAVGSQQEVCCSKGSREVVTGTQWWQHTQRKMQVCGVEAKKGTGSHWAPRGKESQSWSRRR